MNDRPEKDGAMFFVGMEFAPTEQLKQSELNRILVHMLSKLFTTADGEPLAVPDDERTMLMVVQFLVKLGLRLDEATFAEIPPELRRYFMVIHRDGTKYRYGTKPRPR